MGPRSARVQHPAEEQEHVGPGSGERRLPRGQRERHRLSGGEVSGTVTVTAASIDTGNTRRDTHLRSADFFDCGNQ
jgi:hypothetical protein